VNPSSENGIAMSLRGLGIEAGWGWGPLRIQGLQLSQTQGREEIFFDCRCCLFYASRTSSSENVNLQQRNRKLFIGR
jgi:hypothetical protein